jgi:hypothetical protein
MMLLSSHQHVTKWCLFFLALGLYTAPSLSLQSPASFDRAVEKAADKFSHFSQQQENPTLMIDGNNVRGIAKFKWNPVELHNRVELFCQEYGISRSIIVWDHGSCKFAAPGSDQTDSGLVVLFSGLSQRADDVMVKESSHLVSAFYEKKHWSSLAFVTNDGGLAARLRRKAQGPSREESAEMPLIMDSTRFVELLYRIDEDRLLSKYNHSDSLAMQAAQDSLRGFVKIQKVGYNSRREKTWERCVLAETLRRVFGQRSLDICNSDDSFAMKYIQDLETRGYSNPSRVGVSAGLEESEVAFPGPSRLDKRERRLLGKYNMVREREELC